MSAFRFPLFCVVAVSLILVVLVGCQGSGGKSPISPGLNLDLSKPSTPAVQAQARVDEPRLNGHCTWGLWEVTIDPDKMVAEVVPLRGSEWHANVVEFMQPPYASSNLGLFIDVGASNTATGLFAVDVTLRHPFPNLPQFRGFDVRGGFLADGSYISKQDSTAVLANPDPAANEARLLNADGYMRWFNPTEFNVGTVSILKYINTKLGTTNSVTATLNPYKYFSDDFLPSANKNLTLQEVTLDPAVRGTFSTTSAIARRYMIQFPMATGNPVFKFTYVIDASYNDPKPGSTTYAVTDYPLSANMQECNKIVCQDAGSTAYWKSATENGGDLQFNLELFDWQSVANSTGAPGEIGSVVVESPTLLSNVGGKVDVTGTFKATAAPGTTTSSICMIDIPNVTPTAQTNQVLFITVTSANPTDYSNPFGQPFPTGRVLASYYMWVAPIAADLTNHPPVVGQVTGPTPVNSTMGALNYSAPVTDPDTGQTLTSTWSVVPTGQPANWTIPGKPDLSVDIDWSAYVPAQDYDVNIRVHDGFAFSTGSLLTVHHNNTAPTAGQVSGKTPVTVADTNTNYSAPIMDPDTAQTLTAMWSVVPHGQPASFVIPANGAGHSLDQNWSTYAVGQYDVNVQVLDGVAAPATGTFLVVDLLNTPPTLGAISGATSVSEANTAEQYDPGTLTDPDVGQVHTYLWSLVPNGQAPSFIIAPNGPGNSLVVDWCGYPVGQYDMQVRVSDGFANGDSPVLDIIRSLSVCAGNAHSFSGPATWNQYSTFPAFSLRIDIDFFRTGNFAGQGVVQAGENSLENFVATGAGVWANPPLQFVWGLPSKNNTVTSLDCSPDLDPFDGTSDNRIVTVLSKTPDIITVFDADTFLGYNILATLTDVSGSDNISCIAVNQNDDIWAIVRSGGSTVNLEHWAYVVDNNLGGPYYTYKPGDKLNVTADIPWGTPIFDMVIAPSNNHLYLLEAGLPQAQGKIHEINLNTGPPTYLASTSNPIFTSPMKYDFPGNKAVGADIMIDNMISGSCDPTHCRLSAMSFLDAVTPPYQIEVVRLDTGMNVLNSQQTTSAAYWPSCGAISTNPNVNERFIVNPGTSELFVWTPPVDW